MAVHVLLPKHAGSYGRAPVEISTGGFSDMGLSRMMSQHPDFCCVICEHQVNTRWSSVGPTEELPPVCRYCEHRYAEGGGKPTAGSFRDRRNAIRIYALAEALHTAAMRIHWSTHYAAA